MATAETKTENEPTCPICLGHFKQPRQLPCAHPFCQSCLQSYISTEAIKHEKQGYIECPVCRQTANPSTRNKPINEWASLFPVDTVLQSILPTKSKIDHACDACYSEGVSVPADGFCAMCEEAMCDNCLKVHKKQKISKNHSILAMEELTSNPRNVMKFAEGFTCSKHDGEDVKFYCWDHKAGCCGICLLNNHKTCSKVTQLKDELATLLGGIKLEEIYEELKKIEAHLKMCMEINESNVNDLESQVKSLTDQIKEMRNKINTAIDEWEKKVKTEGNKIFKEEAIRIQEENQQCLLLIQAVRNSYITFESVHNYGSDIQKFLMSEKVISQLQSYSTQVREKYKRTNKITVKLENIPVIESIMSLFSSDVGKLITTSVSKHRPLCTQKPAKDCMFEKVAVIDLNTPGRSPPGYSSITLIASDNMLLADYFNKQCILLNSSYEFISSYKLTGYPWSMCALEYGKVAVSLRVDKKILILSVRNDVITLVRTITTKYICNAIAVAKKGTMVVTGNTETSMLYWSLITNSGEEQCNHQYASPTDTGSIAINSTITRVYITIQSIHSLLCFHIDGEKQFTYSPDNLRNPIGISLDRDDNIYVLGSQSQNIHQLSPDGSVLQVITNGIPRGPWACYIDNRRNLFFFTNDSEKRKLHLFQLK
ncbi:hypothetical protein CHS0354_015354 [Potamilus streckersoni]|uniref:RING-type domain-containing protein n=1 Tax=Potamilus streckersoni TaxID=2493646 RepID=A0AAE0TC36_9BIVA|nr:hypothetical protein CHS0354_015354 [Potamilus streckersoni]